jgi:type IV pilus assembly protein PilB
MDPDRKPKESGKPLTVTTRFLKEAFSQTSINATTFVNTIIRESVGLAASDILFEPLKPTVRIRARIDGVLYHLGDITHDSYPEISSRIKVLAELDPTEKRRIQEGQFTLQLEGRLANLRVEIAKTIHGELIVIRIHERQTIVMDLAQLGFNNQAFQNYNEMLKAMGGLILVCGPTGCGKTTTLYSTISKLNENQDYNVMTIEDPVEFQLQGVNQMQTSKDIDFTFAEGLRTILRLSPDIIFVGEIRDRETAEIAIESGLTGQLVLSTVHAEDSVGALFRLLDLGIESYLLNSSLLGIVAQRLVRKLCLECRTHYQPSADEIELFQQVIDKTPKQLMKAVGCVSCQNLAFKGRTGIYEVLKMNSRVRELVRSKVNEDNLRDTLKKDGFTTLLRDGLEKCYQGITTVNEVLRNSLRVP